MLSTNRPLEIAAFLDQHGWSDATQQAFDGDFSPRRYARLTRADGKTAILMDADADQNTVKFVIIDEILRACGVNAPEIFAANPMRGLVLMQDFGTRHVGTLIDNGAEMKPYLLRGAEILAQLHTRFNTAIYGDLPLKDCAYFLPRAALFLDYYFPFTKGREASAEERTTFLAAWKAVLQPIDQFPTSLLLHDFMPDNLMDLGNDILGVLDFQDAGIGCIAYDLMSLCDEVRRDGASKHLSEVIRHYNAALARQGGASLIPEAELHHACIVMSAQRHTKMLGGFVRVSIQKNQPERLKRLPYVKAHLFNLLADPYLQPVRDWMEEMDVL